MSELFTFEGFKIKDDLQHYGIKGQKWGERHYQNPDGSLTPAGRERYGHKMTKDDKKALRKEIKTENKKAFELGKEATLYSRAAEISNKKAVKYSKQGLKAYSKDPTVQKQSTKNKMLMGKSSVETTARLKKLAEDKAKEAKEHYNSLVEKYGKENIKEIIYDKNGNINEKVINGKTIVSSVLGSIVGVALSDTTGVGFIVATKTKNEQANKLVNMMMYAEYKQQKDYVKKMGY